MAKLRRRLLLLAAIASVLCAGAASAGQIAFNFSSLNTSSTAAQISSLMTSQAVTQGGAGWTVSVSSGVQVNTNYAGDNHVVGPTIGGTVVPWTLGDSGGTVTHPTAPTSANPTYSAYLATTSSFTITFNKPVTSVEFDFEIFPAASPPVPQFEFSAADASNHTVAMYYNNTLVGQPWTVNAIAPGAHDPYLPGNPVTYTHSPVSGPSSTETSNQLLGVGVFQFTAAAPAYQLTFADWPEEIGINNLIINPTGVGSFVGTTPAPPSALLLGFGGLGIAAFVARSRRRVLVAA
jgi:hypothetical protein